VNLADDDEAFHLALIGVTRNEVLLCMTKSLHLMTRAVRRAYFNAAGNPSLSIIERERILRSVADHDGEKAPRLMRKHYAGSSARWRKVHGMR
jgi:DNA-binding FadR family transcriptional regulator